MKRQTYLFILLSFTALFLLTNQNVAQLPEEKLLWPDGLSDNPVKYKAELFWVGNEAPAASQKNRAFSCVSVPTYILHKPEKNKTNGVALVICPGGGFRDVWFDQEGNDIALYFAKYGITSLVLKYRTYNTTGEGTSVEREVYNAHVYADAKQAIYTLRSRAEELGIDKNKIGIGGFSAGGTLSLFAALELYEDNLPGYAQSGRMDTKPDFSCLIYPGIRDSFIETISRMDSIPPMFIVNGREDQTTPALKCLNFYKALLEKNVPAELHIYAKGGHGFDSGLTEGHGVGIWMESFIAWLKDMEIIED